MTRKEFVAKAPDKKFAEWVWNATKDVKPLARQDLPHVWYCKDGDIMHVILATNDKGLVPHYYVRRGSGNFDTMHEFETNRLVGFEVWGFRKATSKKIEDGMSAMGLVHRVKGAISRKMAQAGRYLGDKR